MARCYTVVLEQGAWLAADTDIDLFEFDPAAEKPIQLYGLFIKTTTEVAEAQEEWLRLQISVGHTTTGSGGTTPTPQIIGSATGQAAGFGAKALNETIASAGTASQKHADAFQVRAGYDFWFPEGSEPEASGTALLVVRGMSTVTDDVLLNATAYVREFG